MPQLQSAALGVWVQAGSRSETPEEHGIAHLLEHMAFKGTQKRTAIEIAEEIEDVGGELNAATSIEHTSYYARVLKDDVPLAVDILADILQNASVDPRELAKEQHVILQEIGASHDAPEEQAFDVFQETAFPGQAIGRPILGTPESVTGFDPIAVKNYLSNNYHASNMVVSAAGGVEHSKFVELVSQSFNKLRDEQVAPPKPARYQGGSHVDVKPLMEAQIILGFEGRAYHHEDFFKAQLLSAVLGGGMSSRLFQEVREKRGLCYSVYSFHWGYSDTGVFGIHAATGEEDIQALMPVILGELERVCDDLTEEELKRSKAQMRAGLLMGLESPAARASQLARHLMLFDRVIPPDELSERINLVSADELRTLAGNIFSNSKPTLAAVGPVSKLMPAEAIEARLGALDKVA